MSQENVETVRRAFEAFARHDNEAIFPLYDPEVEIHDVFLDHLYRGFDGVREFFRDWLAAWDEYSSEVGEWIDAGDHVIAAVHTWGRGKQSGVPVEQRQWHVWRLRDGKLWRLRVYATKDDALKAVGLEG
jgi:uncharacterized protein